MLKGRKAVLRGRVALRVPEFLYMDAMELVGQIIGRSLLPVRSRRGGRSVTRRCGGFPSGVSDPSV